MSFESPAARADQILHSHNQHAIARMLDEAGPDALATIKEMQNQAKHLHMQLPSIVIDGLTEHLVNEARRGENISSEYNALNGDDKKAVTRDLETDKTGRMHITETPKGELESMTVDIASGVSKIVYQKEGLGQKLKDHVPRRIEIR